MNFLEKQFKLKENGTDIKTELIAGLTTFATMAYVLATVPSIMSSAGFGKSGVLTMVIILCAITSIAMGIVTNRPFVLGPGLGSVAVYSISMIIDLLLLLLELFSGKDFYLLLSHLLDLEI